MADLSSGQHDFAADDGSVPTEVGAVLARHADRSAGIAEVVAVLARHRLLVPLLEVDADQLEGDDADPCAGQDRAVAAVSLRMEHGSLGLAFTGMAALLAWRPEARPMPVTATDVAAALVQEGAAGLLIDPAGPAPCRLPPLAVARLAAGGGWPDPWDDPAVRQSVAAELAPVLATGEVQVRLAAPVRGAGDRPGRTEHAAAPGGSGADPVPAPEGALGVPAGLVVEVRFAPGMAAEVAQERARIIAERLSGSELLRQAFDGVLAVRAI